MDLSLTTAILWILSWSLVLYMSASQQWKREANHMLGKFNRCSPYLYTNSEIRKLREMRTRWSKSRHTVESMKFITADGNVCHSISY